jgi:hypothetical protein
MEKAQPLNFEKATAIAEKFGEKPKAIVAGAIRAGLKYERKVRVSKSGEPVETKEDLVKSIADSLGLTDLEGLEKATRNSLIKVSRALS